MAAGPRYVSEAILVWFRHVPEVWARFPELVPIVATVPEVTADADVEEVLISGEFGVTRTRLGVRITTFDGKTSRAKGYTMTLFRKQSDGRWLFARDANLLTPEE